MPKILETKVQISGELDAALEKAINGAKSQLDKMSEAAKKAASAYDKLGTTIGVQDGTLKSLKKQYASVVLEQGKNSKEAKELAKKIKDLSGEIKTNKERLEKAEDAADKYDVQLRDLEGAADKASGGFTVMKGALANLVAEGFKKAISAAKEFAVSMIDTAAEVKAETSMFEQTFGDFADEATAAINRVAGNTGIIDTRLKTTGASIYAFARSSGASVSEAMELMETALNATADSAAYYDKSLEDSAETLQSYLKGNFANDAALGLSSTEFTRNAKAAELFGKKYNDLTEVQKQQTLLKMVTDSQKLSGAMGQAAREADGWENVQGNLAETWRQFKAQVGTPFLEAIIPVIQDVTTEFTKWRNSVDWDEFSEKISTSADKVISIGTFIKDNIKTIASIAGIILGIVAAVKIWNAVMTIQAMVMYANPTTWIILGIVAAVAALIAIGVALYKNWDTIKAKAAEVVERVKERFANMKEGLANIIENIKEKFRVGFAALVGFVKAPINTVIGLVNKVIDRINEVSIDVPDWVPVLGGKSFGVKIPQLPMLATGGFTNGPSIAGEAGQEAVISFNRAYREQNLSYWAQAGRMLGATVDSGAFLSSGSGGNTSIDLGGVSFAPNITVQGNANRDDIIALIRAQYPEFLDMLESWLIERGEFVYG